MIVVTVLALHVLLLALDGVPGLTLADLPKDEPVKLKIRRVKTAKVEHPHLRPMEGVFDAGAPKPKGPENVSLSDLAIGGGRADLPVEAVTPKVPRPGTRPEVARAPVRAMNRMSLKGKDFKDFSRSFPSGDLAISDMITGAQKISDAVVSIEVPDGIEPDELNEYELMFYGFQKRTAINYVNSILRNLDRFQKKYPNYRIPTTGRITMTARITYDPEGNVQQIKMIRWTHVNELQNLFEDIVKNIDQLHNPPKALWEKNGEFSMFYTLEILNG